MIDNCPSCGLPREEKFSDKPLCNYCWRRGQHSTMKFVILKVLSKSKKRLHIKDILKKLNNLPCIGYPMRMEDLRANLYRLKNYKYLSTSKSDSYIKPAGGRPKLRYTITRRGLKILTALSKRWEHGFLLRRDKKSELRMKNFRMTADKRERAASIRGKILNKEYDKYKFILTNRKYKKKLGMLEPLKSKSIAERKHKIFRWDNVPGIDTKKLINFLKKIYPDIPNNPTIEKSEKYESLKISYPPDKLIKISISMNIKRRIFMIINTGYKDKFYRCTVHKFKNRRYYYIYSKEQPDEFEWNPHIKYHKLKTKGRNKWSSDDNA